MNSWLMVAKVIGLDIFQLINIYGMLFEDRTEKFLLSIVLINLSSVLTRIQKRKKLQVCHRGSFSSIKVRHECFDVNSVCSQRRSVLRLH